MRLSIIITVYNKEQYIVRCLRSCMHQASVEPGSYEILVIDDGSTDNSRALIRRCIEDQENVRLISQDNQGLSVARNNGLKEAKGEYIWFVDADDYIPEEAVSLVLDASNAAPDVIPIRAKTEGVSRVRNEIPTSAKDGRSVMLSKKWAFCSPFYVYKKRFLTNNNLYYYPGIYHEDSELTPRLLFHAESVTVIDKVLYFVSRDPNSITQVPKAKRAYDYIFIANRLSQFASDKVDKDSALKLVFDGILSVIINNALSIIVLFDLEERKEFDRQLYQSRRMLHSLKSGGHIKYAIEYLLFSIFPGHYTQVYSFLKRFAF